LNPTSDNPGHIAEDIDIDIESANENRLAEEFAARAGYDLTEPLPAKPNEYKTVPEPGLKGKAWRRRKPGGFYGRQRPHRAEMEKSVIRAELRNAGWSGADLEAEVQVRFEALLKEDPEVRKQLDKTAPVSVAPNLYGTYPLVWARAIRELDEMHELEQRLRMCTQGRPTDRRLPVAIFERNILENGRPEVICHYKDFNMANEPLHWAYGWPARQGSNREFSSVYKTMHGTLKRWRPQECLRLNVRAILRLREELGDPDIGRYLLVDGTPVIAARDQRDYDDHNPAEEEHLRNGMHSATFQTHGGRKTWRGPNDISVVDVKTGLALGFGLRAGNRPEHHALRNILQAIADEWARATDEPWEPEYLTGDAHFDNEGTHRMLEECFGIHPVFPHAKDLGTQIEWHENQGTPCCAKHGDMKLIQSEGFMSAGDRHKAGIVPGERVPLKKARTRWTCVDPSCPVRETIYWNTNPRAYPYLPFKGVHKSRVALRRALMLRRNASESWNARLKARGIANGGKNSPKWVRTDREMAWLCHGVALAFTLQRLAAVTGVYDQMHEEAEERGLLTPCEPTLSDIEEEAARPRRRSGDGEGRAAA
jgi:hypothetical protein